MKKILMLVCMLLLVAVEACAISPDRIAVGGIGAKAKASDLIRVYGQPTEFYRDKNFYNVPFACHYNKTAWFNFWETHPFGGEIVGADITANNGFKTPDGISVGMPESVIVRTYGQPDIYKTGVGIESAKNSYGAVAFTNKRNDTCYVYTYTYPSYPCDTIALYFECVNGKIALMGIRRRMDMSRG